MAPLCEHVRFNFVSTAHTPRHCKEARAGRVKTQKEVEKQVAELNIQLDNLCQFLPQEKVVEFSKMNPHELLLNTERAIGDAQLARMHSKLITNSKDIKAQQGELCAAARPASHTCRMRGQRKST
jgi:hypothetical protein